MSEENREFIKSLVSLKEMNENIGGNILFLTILYLPMLLADFNFLFKSIIAISYIIIIFNIKKYTIPERPYLLMSFTCFIIGIAMLLEVYNNFLYPIIIDILLLVISYFVIRLLFKNKPLKDPLRFLA